MKIEALNELYSLDEKYPMFPYNVYDRIIDETKKITQSSNYEIVGFMFHRQHDTYGVVSTTVGICDIDRDCSITMSQYVCKDVIISRRINEDGTKIVITATTDDGSNNYVKVTIGSSFIMGL